MLEWKPLGWAEELGQIKPASARFSTRPARAPGLCAPRAFPTRGDKAIRAQSIRGRMALEGLYVPSQAPWYPACCAELLSFPAGKHDDQVDALAWSASCSTRMSGGRPVVKAEEKQTAGYTAYEENSRPLIPSTWGL